MFVVDRLCYSMKGLITVSGFCKPPDADADDIELWLPVANSERSLSIDTAKYIVSLLSDCFTQLLDDENKASALDTRHGTSELYIVFITSDKGGGTCFCLCLSVCLSACLPACLSVCWQDYSKVHAWIWMKC